MANFLSLIAFVVVVGGLCWLAYRFEPHWCSKDGQRFTVRVRVLQTEHRLQQEARQDLARPGAALGSILGGSTAASRTSGPGALSYRWREGKAFVDDGRLQVITRVGPTRRALAPARVLAKADTQVQGRLVYLIDTLPMRELRVPVSSRAVASLDALLELSSR